MLCVKPFGTKLKLVSRKTWQVEAEAEQKDLVSVRKIEIAAKVEALSLRDGAGEKTGTLGKGDQDFVTGTNPKGEAMTIWPAGQL